MHQVHVESISGKISLLATLVAWGHRKNWARDKDERKNFYCIPFWTSWILNHKNVQFSSVQSLSHVPLFATPWTAATPGLPVHHQLPESTQTHVHWVGDAIQPSHPLSSPSPPVFNLSQHQGLFKWVSSSHQVAKVLEFQLQNQSYQWTPRTDLL